jgi:hypothetical protein
MRWHKEGIRNNTGCMSHPSDGTAWKALDHYDPSFARDLKCCPILMLASDYNSIQSSTIIMHEG